MAELPTTDDLFGQASLPTTDELFAGAERQAYRVRQGASPVQDLIFGNTDVNPVARVLDAFGQGARQNWGEGEAISDQSADFLKKAGIFNDYQKGQHSIIKAANEVLMRGAANDLYTAAIRIPSALFGGAQAVAAQLGEEFGQPKLGREIAALPEAFPLFGAELGRLRPPLPPDIASARDLGIIGQGEAGWKGTAPPREWPVIETRAEEIKGHEAVQLPGAAEPGAPTATAAPIIPAAPDIHAVARQIAPQTFQEYDALSARRDTFRRWIGELDETRKADAAANAPHGAEIADLQEKLADPDTTKRLAKKYQARLDPLIAERDAYIAEHTAGDTRDMAIVRQRMMETDYRMRDLAPEVTRAYQAAAEQVPGARPAAAGPEEYIITDPLGAKEEGEELKVRILRDKQGIPEALDTEHGIIKVAPAYRNMIPQQIIAETMGDHPQGAPADLSKVRPISAAATPPEREVIIMRHGATALNADDVSVDRIRGWTDVPLSKEGRREADRLGEQLDKEKPSVILTSDLARAADTAHITSKATGVEVAEESQGFRPWDVGEMAGRKSSEGIPILADYAENKPSQKVPGGESFDDFRKRFFLSLADAVERYQGTPAIVLHHRGERLIKAWEAAGFPANGDIDISVFNQKGEHTDSLERIKIPVERLQQVAANLRREEAHAGPALPVAQPEAAGAARPTGAAAPPRPAAAAPEAEATRPVPAAAPVGEAQPLGKIDNTHTVITGANSSADGTVYIDHRIPEEFHKYLAVHERTEADLMAKGMAYQAAHLQATAAEHAAVTADGLDWGNYTHRIDGYLDKIEHEKDDNPPPVALHVSPETAMGGHRSGNKPAPEGAPAPTPAPAIATPAIEAQRAAISGDVVRQLLAAGRPQEEAQTAGALVAAYYETRAARFQGAKGTPEEMYRKEGAQIVGQGVKLAKGPALEFAQGEETPEFKEWFGDSKIKDADGDPLIVYHGSGVPIERFDTLGGGRTTGNVTSVWGSFFTPDTKEASRYAEDFHKEGGQVTPVYLSIKNPFEMTRREWDSHAMAVWKKEATQEQAMANERQFRESLERDGYDGIIIKGRGFNNEYVAFYPEQIKSAIANRGTFSPLSPNILEQARRGVISLIEGQRPTIRLAKEANASTFIHETGHEWLDRMLRDAKDEQAPADLKTDAGTVLKWLGVDSAEDIKTKHHERFARGFETYMMEGRAPSAALADVFAKFKAWLTQIYQTLTRLRSPINDDIRAVFDRFLVTPEERAAVIAPEREAERGFADRHEDIAERTEPPAAHETAETVQNERDAAAQRLAAEDNDARLAAIAAEAQRRAPRGAEPAGDVNAPGAIRGEAGAPAEPGAIGAGGGEAAAKGAEAPREPTTPAEPYRAPADDLIDKAGNIRLDKLNQPDDIDQVIRDSATRNNQFLTERRNVISDAEAFSLADALGKDPSFLDLKKIGSAYNEEEIIAARRLLVQSATAVRDAAAGAAGADPTGVKAFADAIARHEMIQAKVSGATAEAGRALRAFRMTMEGFQEAAGLSEFLKATGRDFNQLVEMARYGQRLRTPSQMSKFIADTSGGKIKRAIIFYYVNALISGPITHMRYSVGNAINALWTPLVEIPVSATSGAIREALGGTVEDRIYLGEAKAQLFGLIKGSQDGFGAAVEAWKVGQSPALPGERISAQFLDYVPPIQGPIGTAIGIPGKSVAAIHSFFKSLRYEQNIQALAYRQAMKEGLEGEPFNGRIAELTAEPSEEMMASATKDALKELFMSPNKYHSAMGALTRFTNQSILAKIVVPFMKIGSQITRNAFIERTPLGLLDQEVRDNLLGRNGGAAFDQQMGKVATGTGLIFASVGMAAEGLMTGDGPEDPSQRAIWLLNHRPNSITVGNVTVPYQGLGHLGMLMRFAANMYETAHAWTGEDGGKLAVSFVQGISKSVLDENFMRGAKDLLDAVYHPDEYGSEYVRNFVTNWMPYSVGMGQIARKVDPYMRETKGENIVDSIFKTARAKLPYVSEGLSPRRDRFGEPIPSGAPLPNYANDRVVQELERIPMGIGKYERKIRGVRLTDQQYDDFVRQAGRMTKMLMNNTVSIPGFAQMPVGQRQELLHNDIKVARQAIESLIIMQSEASRVNPIMSQAFNAKVQKRRPAATVH